MNTFKTKRVGEGQLDRFNVPLLIIIKEEHWSERYPSTPMNSLEMLCFVTNNTVKLIDNEKQDMDLKNENKKKSTILQRLKHSVIWRWQVATSIWNHHRPYQKNSLIILHKITMWKGYYWFCTQRPRSLSMSLSIRTVMPADAQAATNIRVDVICNGKTWRWHEILQHFKKESWIKQNPQIFHRCLGDKMKIWIWKE